MKRVAVGAAVTALVLGFGELCARVAVDRNAAGALLSPGGSVDPSAWLVAGMYVCARLGGAAMACCTFGLAAAAITSRVIRALPARERIDQ